MDILAKTGKQTLIARKTKPFWKNALKYMRVRTVLLWLLLAPPAIILAGVLYAGALMATGHYVHKTGGEVAKILVAKKKSAEGCRKIRWLFNIFGPTEGEHRAWCFYEFAQRAHDPRVCEYLMPSDYGVSCITSMLPSIEGPRLGYNCESDKKQLSCYSIVPLDKPDIIVEYSKCDIYEVQNTRDWCYINRVADDLHFNDCSGVGLNQDHKDHCIYQLALKTENGSLCNKIQHPLRKAVCSVYLEMKKQYPYSF